MFEFAFIPVPIELGVKHEVSGGSMATVPIGAVCGTHPHGAAWHARHVCTWHVCNWHMAAMPIAGAAVLTVTIAARQEIDGIGENDLGW